MTSHPAVLPSLPAPLSQSTLPGIPKRCAAQSKVPSVAEQAIQAIGAPVRAADLARRLDIPVGNMFSVLQPLVAAGRVARLRRGLYAPVGTPMPGEDPPAKSTRSRGLRKRSKSERACATGRTAERILGCLDRPRGCTEIGRMLGISRERVDRVMRAMLLAGRVSHPATGTYTLPGHIIEKGGTVAVNGRLQKALLAVLGEPRGVRELAEALAIPPANVVSAAKALVTKGVVVRIKRGVYGLATGANGSL